MNSEKREKIALIVLLLLIFLGLSALGAYLVAGHSWNVAASNLDDTLGSMEGYTTIVFEGTQEKSVNSGPQESSLSFDDSSVSINRVYLEYMGKGSDVLNLNTLNPSIYSEPTVVNSHEKRFGVFYLQEDANINSAKASVLALSKFELDGIIAIVTDLDDIKNVDGIDIAICFEADKLAKTGEYIGDTFCIPAVSVGSVGAILISPNNVVSFKTITASSSDLDI